MIYIFAVVIVVGIIGFWFLKSKNQGAGRIALQGKRGDTKLTAMRHC